MVLGCSPRSIGQEQITLRKARHDHRCVGRIPYSVFKRLSSAATAAEISCSPCRSSLVATLYRKEQDVPSGIRLDAITIAYVGGALVLAPYIWMGWSFEFAKVSAPAWWGLIYMAVFPAVFAYLFTITRSPIFQRRVFRRFRICKWVATVVRGDGARERISTLLFGGHPRINRVRNRARLKHV